jgi:hypothetical protein
MAKLRAPDSLASFSYGGETYSAKPDGSVEFPDHLANHFLAHGCSPWVDEVPEEVEPDDEFAAMKREELLAYLREAKVPVKIPINYPQLRKLCRETAARRRAREAAAKIEAEIKATLKAPIQPVSFDLKNGLKTEEAAPAPAEPEAKPEAKAAEGDTAPEAPAKI